MSDALTALAKNPSVELQSRQRANRLALKIKPAACKMIESNPEPPLKKPRLNPKPTKPFTCDASSLPRRKPIERAPPETTSIVPFDPGPTEEATIPKKRKSVSWCDDKNQVYTIVGKAVYL